MFIKKLKKIIGKPFSYVFSALFFLLLCLCTRTAEKSGIASGLTKALATLGAPYGVRCCSVSPGPVLTRPSMSEMKTALGRAAEPIEVVKLVLYLCSDDAAFITGTNYLIEGGQVLLNNMW